jgi:type IV secretory pathway TrbF-like protein
MNEKSVNHCASPNAYAPADVLECTIFQFGGGYVVQKKIREGGEAVSAGAPPVVNPVAARQWFEVEAAPVLERNRYFMLCLALTLALMVALVTLMVLMPLKTVVPFVLEKTEEGALIPAAKTAQQFKPGAAEKRYFLAQWVTQLLSLDSHLSEVNLAQAYLTTRGKATVEFTDWLGRTTPMTQLKNDPTLTRTVSISSISLIEDEVALVRVVTERRSNGNPLAQREKFVITLHFVLVPQKTEEELMKNPLGLFITHFQINTDLEK